jgi:hypothetical protein
MRLEGLGKLKKKSTLTGVEAATFRLVAQCFIQLRCLNKYKYTATCRVVHATKMTGSSSDDWIY